MITLGYITLAIGSILGFAHIGLRAAELDVYLEGGTVEKKKYNWTSFKKKYLPIIVTVIIFMIVGAGGFIGHIISNDGVDIILGCALTVLFLVLFAAIYARLRSVFN